MKTSVRRTALAIAVVGLASASAVAAEQAQQSAAAVAAGAAERAAVAAGGRVVHEIDGKTVVVRGSAAAAQAAATASGAAAVVAGSGPIRLRGAAEDAAIAALTADQRAQLEQALRTMRDGAQGGEDSIRVSPAARAASASATTAMAYATATSAAATSAVAASAAATGVVATTGAGAATGAVTSLPTQPGTEHVPAFYDTSEFLDGRIAVNVVFVQGADGRDWSDDDKSDALSDLVDGLDMWAQEFPRANLSFRYRTFTTSTNRRPIEESSDNRAIWIEQGMEQLGFGRHSTLDGWMQHYDNVYELDNDARAALGTDWAFTCFMVRAANGIGDAWDAAWNGTSGIFAFADGKAAFTMLGGPYMVMPYSKIWGVHFWNVPILSHEFGHVFYALDEYPAYAAQGHDASERAGYFHVQNGNLQGPGALTNQSCIMRGSFKAVLDYILDHIVSIFTFGATASWDYDVCGFTLGQMGYVDANANGRLDVFDAPPVMVMPQSGVNTSWNLLWAFFQVEVGATPNGNDYARGIHPASAKRDVAIDAVTGIWTSVNGSPWQSVYLNQNPPCGQGFLVMRSVPSTQYWSSVTVYVATASGNWGMQTFWVHR